MALLELIEVSKNFETQKILCEVNFSIDSGERIAIIGKNGSGKSTLMKIVMGVIEFEGRRVVNSGLKIEMLGQEPRYSDNISVKEAIERELKEIYDKSKDYMRFKLFWRVILKMQSFKRSMRSL